MYLEPETTRKTQIAVCDSDFAARCKPCDNCGRKIARVYGWLRGRNMRLCDDCAKLASKVH